MTSDSDVSRLPDDSVAARSGRTIYRKIAIGSVTVQLLIVLCQICALMIYDTHISQHMPNMIKPDYSDWVTKFFEWGVIYGPFFAQFFLWPIALTTISTVSKFSWLWLGLAIMSVFLWWAGWYCSLLAFGCAVGTYD